MALKLEFAWEDVTESSTLSSPKDVAAADHIYPASRMSGRQAAFYRNLIRMTEQTGTQILPVNIITIEGEQKRLGAGCIKLAEHARFIRKLENGPNGFVEEVQLAWDPAAK